VEMKQTGLIDIGVDLGSSAMDQSPEGEKVRFRFFMGRNVSPRIQFETAPVGRD